MDVRAVTDTDLQHAYSAYRVQWSAEFRELRAQGAFIAPEHLRPALQGALGLVEPLREDAGLTEAA
jgi:hypothetical protein